MANIGLVGGDMVLFVGFPRDDYDHGAEEVGWALAGLVERDAAGLPRVGMLGAGPSVSAVGASWKVQIGRFVYVHQIAGAAQFSGSTGAEQVDIEPATGIPAGQARIDRIVWDQVAAELRVITGTVSASPVVPPVGGLAPVGRVRVESGDGIVVAARVTPDFAVSALAAAGETRTVPLTVTGSEAGVGVTWWRNFAEVKFLRPFAEVPRLEATAVFSAGAVQVMQVTAVTRTGFTARGIRHGASQVQSGTVTYTATAV